MAARDILFPIHTFSQKRKYFTFGKAEYFIREAYFIFSLLRKYFTFGVAEYSRIQLYKFTKGLSFDNPLV